MKRGRTAFLIGDQQSRQETNNKAKRTHVCISAGYMLY